MATAQRVKTGTELQPLVEAQGASRAAITAQVLLLARGSAERFDGWYDHDRITTWAASLVKLIEPLLRLLASNTDAYAAKSVSAVAGKRFRPIGRIDVNNMRTGITHEGAFGRASNVYRFQQSRLDQFTRDLEKAVTIDDNGKASIAPDFNLGPLDLIDPKEAAINRVLDVAETDTALVVRDQTQATFKAAERQGLITGWRRIIHPELSEGGTCGLCVAASDRVYHVDELMPIHFPTCKCVPAAVRDENDPGSVLNDGDLARLYEDAGSTSREDLKRTRYRVDEHGNLGPVLSPANSKPKSASTAKRQSRPTPGKPKTIEQSREDLQSAHDQLAPTLPKAAALAAKDPKKWGPYYQKLQDRFADLERQLA